MKNFSILVPVTQKHIDAAIRQDCRKCVIALAIKDALEKKGGIDKNKITVITLTDHSSIHVDKNIFIVDHPSHISSLIRNFDAGVPVKPTRFMAHFKQYHE